MEVYDRITLQEISISSIESPVVLGRYLDEQKRYIVPCVEDEIGDQHFDFSENAFINNNESLLSNSIISIAEELSLVEKFEDVEDVDAMLKNFDEKLAINEFENFLEEKLFHLEEICRQPAYHLSREITKVNIARAKRVPVRSINYLAAHSEDWSRRGLRGVEPKMVLSETVEYDLRIYENKITSKLIDKLLHYCGTRIENDIHATEKVMQKVDDILEDMKRDENLSNYWYKKRKRDYSRLGRILKNLEKSNKQLEELKKYIHKIQKRLFSLLGSELYRKNKNNLLSSDIIEKTNLFDNHQHYRYVKILWHKSFRDIEKDCTKEKDKNRLLISSFVDFSYLLIAKSLKELNFFQTHRRDEYSFDLKHDNYTFSVRIEKTENDIIVLKIKNKHIDFIPMPDSVMNLNTKGEDTYYLTSDKQSYNNILKVSPDDVNSEERITKIIFKYLLEQYVADYYYRINSQRISQYKLIKEWLIEEKDIVVNRGDTKIDLYLRDGLTKRKMDDFKNIINKQKNNLPNHRQREQQLKELYQIEEEVKKSEQHFEKYYICIGCKRRNQRNLHRTENGFRYVCDKCGVSYGDDMNGNVFYKIKNRENIKGDLDDKIGYENIE